MKLTRKVSFGLGILALCLSLTITSCQKDTVNVSSPQSPKQLSLYLTDDPCRYDSVFIDILSVEVKVDTVKEHMSDDHFGDNDNDGDDDHHTHDEFGKWDTLSITPGVYNILALRNGIETLLGSVNLPGGKIRKIRITTGTDNSLVTGGITYSLNLLAGTNHYVYVKIHNEDEDQDEIAKEKTAIRVDFDVCESIKLIGSEYFLKPFCKPFSIKHFGRIEGKVLPGAAHAFVTISNGTDSATATPESNGEYRIRGLKHGTYSITFTGSNGYHDITLHNIEVIEGEELHIPDTTLRL